MPRHTQLVDEDQSISDVSDYVLDRKSTRKRKNRNGLQIASKRRKASSSVNASRDHSPCAPILAKHAKSLHVIQNAYDMRNALLVWFAGVHDTREMPWRKRYNPSLTPDEQAQRAYEVWVSEVMLQQTQVVTVVPYYKRWMDRYPTMQHLAGSNIEEVNALWKGLGYYSRASRLLVGAQKVVKTLDGKLPNNAKDLQACVPGIGRYSAGAICSIAYGERVPALDGNVHRLLSRLLAIHASPKAKATLDLLWGAATKLVEVQNDSTPQSQRADGEIKEEMTRTQYPGDINQALIELGSTVCKVREPRCDVCPLREWCAAYTLTHDLSDERRKMVNDIPDMEDACTFCEPVMDDDYAVTAYPMKADRKKAREEVDVVNVIEWRSPVIPEERWFVLVRRPENGLLAGLYEFPTTVNVSESITRAAVVEQVDDWLSKIFEKRIRSFDARVGQDDNASCKPKFKIGAESEHQVKSIIPVGDVIHIFSHIRKTYRVQWVILEGGVTQPELAIRFRTTKRRGSPGSDSEATTDIMWCSVPEVTDANIGTGVVKVWNLVRQQWEKEAEGM
ncbi:hypothetical protein AX17_004090 [Amanita inopinata Kibby_2008]|nr:hypothetical protein AX17_004090 [Amanita inopinata Kibby_2008]